MPCKNFIPMRSLLLLSFVAGFLYVTGEDSIAQQAEKAKKCFQDKNVNFQEQVRKANECSEQLPHAKDWDSKFCDIIKKGQVPCMEEFNMEVMRECLNSEMVDKLLKSLNVMLSTVCKVAHGGDETSK